jgi:enamine deaminase RidA (YjgF/YER057c/UK114 family)
MAAAGRLLAIGGQVGARPPSMQLERGLVPQLAQALDNVVAIVRAAGGRPGDVVSMTIFVTDLAQYTAAMAEIREVWRRRFRDHYPAMALVEVKGLIEPGAVVEVQALAVLPA